MRHGAILIPTFKRPDGLRKTLKHVAGLTGPVSLEVIVADNDPKDQHGKIAASQLAQADFPWPLKTIVVAEPGVVHVRNALFETALRDKRIDFVALIDDDEWPEPEWIERLLETQSRTAADAVGGTMLPAFVGSPPKWAQTLSLFRQEQREGPTDMIWGACNVLLTRSCLEQARPWFDPRFSFSGGEDVEFFTKLKASGLRFAWATKARVHEDVPPQRTTLGWVRRRAFRIGYSNALTQARWRHRRLARFAILVKSAARLGAVAVTCLRGRQSAERVEAMCQVFRSIGEVAAVAGYRHKWYG